MSSYTETPCRTFEAGGSIAQFTRVVLNSSGLLAAAGVHDLDLGVTENPSYASGDKVGVRLANATGTCKMVAGAAITQYARVHGAASGRVDDTAVGRFIGIALDAATAAGDIVEVLRLAELGTQLLYSNVAASAAITASSTETAFDKNYTIPANVLKAGDVLKVRYQGIATATNSTDTLTIKLYIGGITGTALLTGTATDVGDNNIFAGECTIVIRTIGASGTLVAVGTHTDVPAASGTAAHDITEITASTTIDTTATQQVVVSGKWSTTSGSNSCRLDVMTVERLAA